MSLLVTPEDLSRELAASQPPLLIDLRPAENYCENHLPGAVHLDLFGISSVDTDPAPLKAFFWIIEHLLASRGVSNDVAGRRLRRHVRHSGGARVLVSRVFRPSEHARARRRLQRLDARGAAGDAAGAEAKADRVDRHARPKDSRRLERCERSARKRRMPSFSTREATASIAAPPCGPREAARCRAPCTWSGRTISAPDGAFKSAAELRQMYEHAGVTPDREKS